MLCNPLRECGRTQTSTPFLLWASRLPITDRWSRICPLVRGLGVSPRGTSVLTPPPAGGRSPDSSTKTRARCSRRAFSFRRLATIRPRHRSMATSSRWIARVIGTCGVHPRCFEQAQYCAFCCSKRSNYLVNDPRRHLRGWRKVSPKAVGLRSVPEEVGDQPELFQGGELGDWARGGMRKQGRGLAHPVVQRRAND